MLPQPHTRIDSPPKVLLVEDRVAAALEIANRLREEGYAVDVANNGQDGLRKLLTGSYALAVLDVTRDLDGWTILQTARRSAVRTPVLCVAAHDDVRHHAHHLQFAADHYLVKPFAYSELRSSVRAILRHYPAGIRDARPTTLELADLRVELLMRRAYRGCNRLRLTPRELALLTLLMRRAGEVVSREVIAKEIWDTDSDADAGPERVNAAISRLRAKVDKSYGTKLLHTVPGAGYVLEVRGARPMPPGDSRRPSR